MFWSVPPMFDGDTVAVMATGPSLTPEVAEKARRFKAVVVNNAWRLAPWADVLYACDGPWWQHNQDALAFEGIKVTCGWSAPEGVKLLKRTGIDGFDSDPSCIRTGGNSGYQAVHLAIAAKAKRILLLGFDMKPVGHFFGQHKPPLRNTDPQSYRIWARRFSGFAGKSDIVNCTPGSGITVFPFGDIDGEA